MVNYKDLEDLYRQNLEIDIIKELAKQQQIDISKAMNIYYNSKLSNKIHEGKYGVQYLDYKVLVDVLEKTEPELFLQEK